MDIWRKDTLRRWNSQGEGPRGLFQTDCRLPERGEFESSKPSVMLGIGWERVLETFVAEKLL